MDEEIATMEMVEDTPPKGFLTPGMARTTFLVLAGVAVVALIIAIVAIVAAPRNALTLLVGSLIIVAVVVVAEIVLLLVSRPRQA